ncbi:MAG: TlpA family protein disulfide reductase [Desulfuromonadales bacterium]|nr:TlpA family protein disulfide reductase [Desulfuromonadales bacterium]
MGKILFLCLVIVFATLTACDRKTPGLSGKPITAVEKMPAPDITVTALNGDKLRLFDLKGNVVVLNFWATWCPPCREEIPSMMKLNSVMNGKPYRMVAVSMDEGGKPAIEEFFRTSGYLLPAYTDPDGKAAAAYGVTGFPETFVIDKGGVIIKKIVGPLDWSAPDTISSLEDLMK